MAKIIFVSTEESCIHSRVSNAHGWVDDSRLESGKKYVVDVENKEILFPGKDEPSRYGAIALGEYPVPHQGYWFIIFRRDGDFIQHSFSFLRKTKG